MKVEYLSASRIGTFDQCQLKYHAIYELGKRDGVVHPLTVMGSVVHKVMEISTRARVLGLGGGILRPHLESPLALLDRVARKYCLQEDLLPLAKELIQNALDWGYFRRLDRVEWCEISFYEDLGGVKIKGFIDRLDLFGNSADIIDIKTKKSAFTSQELDVSWQARVYNIAVRRKYPQVTGDVTVSFWVLRHHVQRVMLTAEDAEADAAALTAKANDIKLVTEPEASPSALCRWCPHKDDCKVANQGIKARFKQKHKAIA